MAQLKIRTIFKGFETGDLYYIERNYNDGQEAIWKKIVEIRNGKEKVLAHRRYIGTEFHTELKTDEEKHQWLVGFLHRFEDSWKEDLDPCDNYETVFEFEE